MTTINYSDYEYLNSYPFLLIFWIVISLLLIFLGYRQSKNLFGIRAANQDLSLLVIFWLSIPAFFGVSFAFFSFFVDPQDASNAYSVFFMLAFTVYLVTWYKRKQEAGIILLNLGQLIKTKYLIIEIGIWLIVFLYNCFIEFSEGLETIYDWVIYLIDWAFSIFFILSVSLSRIDFREKGINYLFTIIKWEAIKEYRWIESQDNVLYIRHQAGLPLMPIIMLQIPLAEKNQVEQLLSQYLPTKLNAN